MRSPVNTPKKDSTLVFKDEGHVLEDIISEKTILDDFGTSKLEKTDDLLESFASQVSDKQELKLSASTLDTQVEVREPLRQKRRRRRTTPQELAILEEEYLKDEKPNLLNRERIAARINSIVLGEDRMGSREIQIWFQNKRQAMRRQALHSASLNVHTETVSSSQATKQLCQREVDDARFQQHIEHKISSFKRIPSLRLCTNEGGKAQVMFNVLHDNKNALALYKKDDECENKCKLYSMGKENVPPPDYERNTRVEVSEDEMEACARSLVGLARGWSFFNNWGIFNVSKKL